MTCDLLEWKYLKASPKALVRLDGQPLLSRWINQLEEIISEVDKICVVTNDKFFEKFKTWMNMLDNKEMQKKIILYNNLSSSNEDRLGSVTALQHGIRMLQDNQEIRNPVFVVAVLRFLILVLLLRLWRGQHRPPFHQPVARGTLRVERGGPPGGAACSGGKRIGWAG